MAKVLKLINGVPMMDLIDSNVYEDTYTISSLLSSGTPITLPGGQTYSGSELKVFLDGKRLYVIQDYNYVGSYPRTQISFVENIAAGTVILFEMVSFDAAYSEVYSVGSLVTSGTPITLPDSETYTSDELKIYVDGKRQYSVYDYNYEGSPPRTQVSFTFNLVAGTVILFEKD